MGMIVPRVLFRPVVGINDSQVFSKKSSYQYKIKFLCSLCNSIT